MESLKEIREMLDRFYQGESTLEEERRLKDFFSTGSVPEELLADRELFLSFLEEGLDISVPGDLDQQIIAAIDREEKKDQKARRINLYSLSGLAAGLLALIAVYLFFLRDDRPELVAFHQVDTYEDPMKAYEEAKQTLFYVSAKLNSGTSELKYVKEATKATVDPLKSLSKINKGSKELNLLGQLQRAGNIER